MFLESSSLLPVTGGIVKRSAHEILQSSSGLTASA